MKAEKKSARKILDYVLGLSLVAGAALAISQIGHAGEKPPANTARLEEQKAKVEKAYEEARRLADTVVSQEAAEEAEVGALGLRRQALPAGSPEIDEIDRQVEDVRARYDTTQTKKLGIEAMDKARMEDDRLGRMYEDAGLRADGTEVPKKQHRMKFLDIFKRKKKASADGTATKKRGFFGKLFGRKKNSAATSGGAVPASGPQTDTGGSGQKAGKGFLKGAGGLLKGLGKKKGGGASAPAGDPAGGTK